MSWYCGTFYCGHEGYINLIGPAKNREKMKEYRFSSLCPACSKADLIRYRQGKNVDALLRSRKLELPELEGSAKQTAWANTIRLDILQRLGAYIDVPRHFADVINQAEQRTGAVIELSSDQLSDAFQEMLQYLMKVKCNAAYWINNRYESNLNILTALLPEYLEWRIWYKPEDDLEAFASADSILAPRKTTHAGIVILKGSPGEIRAYYEKDASFLDIIKTFGCKWNGLYWYRKLNDYSGLWEDRVAELGNALLLQGFSVSIDSLAARQHAVDANFCPEQRRWIRRSLNGRLLYVALPPGSPRDMLQNIRHIPTASYRYGGFLVDPSRYAELEDFADMYGFSFDEEAKLLLRKYKATLQKAACVEPSKDTEATSTDRLREILESSNSILEDLTDDP